MPMPLYSFFKFIDRFFMYYFWVYPLLYVFWPTSRRQKEEESYNSSVASISASDDSDPYDVYDYHFEKKPRKSQGFLLDTPTVQERESNESIETKPK
jgi:hypothetical protein